MFRCRSLTLLPLACLIWVGGMLLGCKETQGPAKNAVQQNPETRFVDPPDIDDAQLVVAACGAPRADAVLPIYNKLNNGPVRRMVYTGKSGRRPVTFTFIPSHPLVKTAKGAPLPRKLPEGSVWRFDDAQMEKEVMLSSKRISIYLPCAGDALAKEY